MKKVKILLLVIFGVGLCLTSHAEDAGKLETLFLKGEYEKSVSESDRLIGRNLSNADEVYYLKGLALLKLARFRAARENFEKILSGFKRSKRRFDAEIAIGDSYYLEGNKPAARKIYADVLNRYSADKNIALAHHRLSMCDEKAGSLYSIQVGYFKTRANASRLKDKLSKNGYDSFVESATDDGKQFYRVKVGRYKNEADAKKTASLLKSLGYTTKICIDGSYQ